MFNIGVIYHDRLLKYEMIRDESMVIGYGDDCHSYTGEKVMLPTPPPPRASSGQFHKLRVGGN